MEIVLVGVESVEEEEEESLEYVRLRRECGRCIVVSLGALVQGSLCNDQLVGWLVG